MLLQVLKGLGPAPCKSTRADTRNHREVHNCVCHDLDYSWSVWSILNIFFFKYVFLSFPLYAVICVKWNTMILNGHLYEVANQMPTFWIGKYPPPLKWKGLFGRNQLSQSFFKPPNILSAVNVPSGTCPILWSFYYCISPDTLLQKAHCIAAKQQLLHLPTDAGPGQVLGGALSWVRTRSGSGNRGGGGQWPVWLAQDALPSFLVPPSSYFPLDIPSHC